MRSLNIKIILDMLQKDVLSREDTEYIKTILKFELARNEDKKRYYHLKKEVEKQK